jgi:hypothetical protein
MRDIGANRLQRLVMLRQRRMNNMTTEQLARLNKVLCGKGCHWATEERIMVCKTLGVKLSKLFKEEAK